VRAAAPVVAALYAEPMPPKFPAAAATLSGTTLRNDIAYLLHAESDSSIAGLADPTV
jgi:hypothetical protein